MHMDYSGYINAHAIGMNFKDLDEINNKKIIINLGNDNLDFLTSLYKNTKDFSVYIGSHGDIGAR